MGRSETQGLSDFLTFISPCIIIVLFFLCIFRFLFTCCACRFRSRFGPNEIPNASTEAVAVSMIRTQHLNMSSLPLNYDHLPFIFSAERPPKYEDAIKMPTATPRRSSAIPPPFYDNVSLEDTNDFSTQCPPAYWSIRRATVQGIRPTGSGLNTNATNNAFIVAALPSPSVPLNNSDIPIELSPAMLLEKRLNVPRNASLTQDSRPITGINSSAEILPASQRPFTTHSRYMTQIVPPLPGQITEANSLENEILSSDSEKTTQ